VAFDDEISADRAEDAAGLWPRGPRAEVTKTQ